MQIKEYLLDSWSNGYQQRSNNTLNRRKKYFSENKKKITFYSKDGSDLFKSKSKSLDFIIEELYLSGVQESIEVKNFETNERITRRIFPRIKLTRSLNNLETEKFVIQMSTEENFENSSQQGGDTYIESNCKDFENFTPYKKYFEDKPLNGHIEHAEKKIIWPGNNQLREPEFEQNKIQPSSDDNTTNKFKGMKLEFEGKFNGDSNVNAAVESEKFNSENTDGGIAVNSDWQQGENCPNNQSISEWYNSLKQHFEKTEFSEGHKSKEMTCRITGATLKKSNATVGDQDKDTKHYFTRLVKNNRSLIDEELPDPDKVKNIRAMFQENSNSTLKKNLCRGSSLGGSLQNISAKSVDEYFARPMSAQCNREDIICELLGNDDERDKKMEAPKDLMNEIMNENSKKKLLERYERDLRTSKESRSKKLLQPKWTDTGSISSGVSSDLSSYETDVENFSKEETEVEQEDIISDDGYLDGDKDKHFVENDFLEKIRSFGTTVTYYGGEMIDCSVGPILSPTAIAIMNEINEKYGNKGSITKSFAAFYRKYVEMNEPYTMKKLTKSKSFGQSDIFQKPNVMKHNEIDMYKNDLEAEVGIRKPSGVSSNTLKRNLNKSKNTGCLRDKNECDKTQTLEKPCLSPIDSAKQVKVINDNNNIIEHKEISCETVKLEPKEQENYVQQSDSNQSNTSRETRVEEFIGAQIQEPQSEVELKDEYIKQESHKIKEPREEIKLKCFETTPKEILFGYEKNLLQSKRQSDIEFEEFEVCNSINEKIEKSQIANAENIKNSEKSLENQILIDNITEIIITRKPSQETLINNNNKEITITDPENITIFEVQSKTKEIKEELEPSRKINADSNEEGKTVELNNEIREKIEKKKGQSLRENGCDYETDKNKIIAGEYDYCIRNQKMYRNKNLRWPIETSVVVDIQREADNTPKIITNGKISSKSRKRLF